MSNVRLDTRWNACQGMKKGRDERGGAWAMFENPKRYQYLHDAVRAYILVWPEVPCPYRAEIECGEPEYAPCIHCR